LIELGKGYSDHNVIDVNEWGMKKIVWPVMVLLLAGCGSMVADESAAILGEWRIEYIGQKPVIDASPATIAFQENGRFAGNASCNRYFGNYTWEGGKLEIGEGIGATKMMCAVDALMEQEDRLFNLLPKAATAAFENSLLVILDKAGEPILTAAPNE
jgi:heat shock protein HslJ